jgi:uncharacterized protein YcbK (DUF882 family)
MNAKETPSGEGLTSFALKAFRSLTKRAAVGVAFAVLAGSMWSASVSNAAAETRSLKLYFTHTGEKANITFKRNGRYDAKGLAQINQLLRDWRKNEPTKMDPRLFDLVWEVYRRSGAKEYIHVVSAYRSPATNGMLRGRSRSSGVAKNSQHTLGKAMDFYIPGVKLATLRSLAMQMQVGGVGFYPKSGSPFVHLDVGGVRAWPRMSRQELVRIFPKGNTLHLPSDGQPLPGYDQALADYKKRVGASSIEIASTAGSAPAGERKRRGFLATLFGGGADEEEDNSESSTPTTASPRQQQPSAPANRPAADEAPAAPVMVASAEPQQPETIAAPIPASRPAFRQDGPGSLATALYSQRPNPAQEALSLQAAAAAAAGRQVDDESSFEDLANYAVPVPTLLGARGLKADSDTSSMMASLENVPVPEQLAAVPLPAHRPAAPPAVALATPEAAGQAEQEEQALTPELVAALSRSVEDNRPSPAPVAAIRPASIEKARAVEGIPASEHKPVYVAVPPQKVIQAPSRARQFGDGFDAPKVASVATAPTKGGRSTRPEPVGSKSTSLTQDAVAQWALNNSKAGDVASVKAPRVVTRTLNSEYSAAYGSEGFRPVSATVAIDPSRFN